MFRKKAETTPWQIDAVSVRRLSSSLWEAAPYGFVVGAYTVLDRWIERALTLTEDDYRGGFLAAELAVALATPAIGLVGLVVVVAILVTRRTESVRSWPELDGGSGLRPFVLLLVGWSTWAAVTFDRNLFLHESFDLDRTLLVLLALLAAWRPVFVIPHLFLFQALEHQFDDPFGRQIFSRVILEQLLVVFVAWLLAGAVARRHQARVYVFVAGAVLASFYWYPGVVKLRRGWLTDGSPYLGGFAAYVNGWLASWPIERVDRLIEVGRLVDPASRVFTVVVELAAVLFLVHRWSARILLVSWVFLHAGIWLFSGVSFLVWIAVDIAFLGLLLVGRGRVGGTEPWFSPVLALAGTALIVVSPIWVRPPAVGWFDTRLVYTYRYVAVDSAGNVGAFPADATPLWQAWCARDFPRLLTEPALPVRFGKTNDHRLAGRIAELDGSPEALFALEREIGVVQFDARAAADFDRFLAETAREWNERRSWGHPLSWAAPPATCLWPKAPPEPLIGGDHPIETIHVDWLTFFYDGEHYDEVRRHRVRTIDIAP